ncbi:choice-of-anchor J domain-containing protein [Ekhidna sp. MALMAid0563]|uniref:T9SS-dependent choice-of-anchor J family protein n=1 Tax=Ekhidna sp. MALMAid0563 TaxID=3143937 RepID=UPI0032E0055A
MRFGLLIVLLTFATFNLNAQERCGTQAPTTGEFENWISTKIAERQARAEQPLAPLYQIPVVVHVFHKGEPVGTGVNLSEERIKAQVDSLTADFRRMNADASNTPSVFLPVAADIEIEFVLAKQDPAGNPTNGIVRIRGSRDSYRSNSHRPLLRSESYWPAEHYLNIFVLDLEVFLGYASFPLITLEGITNGTEDYILDGVLIDHQYFGVNTSAPAFESYGRTLTHEVGHYLGLRHIWGDGGCSVDDFVDDTPLADTDNGDYSSPCTFPNPDDNTVCVMDEPEMFQNYMDYTDDICMNLFTKGQKTRMRTVMDNAPNRTSLISSPGLSEPSRFADDLAAVDILSPALAECETTLTPELRVVNYGTTEITSYDVQLLIDSNPVGSPQSIATSLQPLDSDTVSFSSQTISANSTISFEISNVNGGTDSNSSNNTISQILTATSSTTLPFIQDMESAQGFLGNIGSDFPWEVTTAPKETPSNNALIFKAYNNTEWFGEETILKTPVFDLTNITSGEIQFSYAHANRPDAFYDGFMIKASVDCGETFPDILFSNFGPDLATTNETDAYFTPANQLEWMDTLVSITDYRGIDGVQFAFVGINGSGNNIYLDNVQVVETNLFENDVKPLSIAVPLVTCSETSEISFSARNNGSETVTSFGVKFFVNGDTSIASFNGLNLSSKESNNYSFLASGLNVGENEVGIKITTVNSLPDESIDENIIKITLDRDNIEDEYPLTVDFEVQDNWQLAANGQSNLWERIEVASNGTLRANGFDATALGEKSWFISPRLNTGGLDSAGLYFRASYASRDGFDDELQVLLSTDCGQTYYQTHLLDADSDSLAVTTSEEKWVPSSDSDWKEYRIDLSQTFFFDEEIRIAFVFTPGGGNDLYIDDISIRGNEPPTYADFVRTYPNPAASQFNVGLNLSQKESVVIRLQDISGKIVFEERIDNALNQVLEYKAPSQEGLYFLTVTGRGFCNSQKLFISR